MRILMDVDGVLADFVGAYIDTANQWLGTNHTRDQCKSWRFMDDLALTAEEQAMIGDIVNQRNWCASIEALRGAEDGIHELSKLAEIHYVTTPWHTSPFWAYERAAWLGAHFGAKHSQITSTGAKHICQGDILIDDGTHNLTKWAEHNPLGAAIQWQTCTNRNDGWKGIATSDWGHLIGLVKLMQ